MEGGIHRGRWNKKAPVGTILLLMGMFTVTLTLTQNPEEQLQTTKEPKCPDGDHLNEEKNICCNKCPPGYKLLESCRAEGHRSNCTRCPLGQYTDQINYALTCRSCKRCRLKHEIEVSKCKPNQNTICRCEEGYYKSVIDKSTYECLKCTQCGADERTKSTCIPERDTECECKENYYRVKKKCVPCKNCSTECPLHCLSQNTKAPDVGKNDLINIMGGVVGVSLVMLVMVAVVTYVVTKWLTKKKMLKSSCQPSDESSDSCEQGLIRSEGSPYINSDKAIPQSLVNEQEQPSNLPDCVPSGVNDCASLPSIPDLIYTVLDLVPVPQMKQLVRSLGVRDTEIEQAELDHRSCREARYQMLRVWAERGSRAGGMQRLLDELRKMHLEWAAEELETKYSIQ